MTNEEEAAQDVDRMMEEAQAALEARQFDMAADLFRRVVQTAPFRHDARQGMADALDRQLVVESGGEPAPVGARPNGKPYGKPNGRPNGNGNGFGASASAANGESRGPRGRLAMWIMATVVAILAFGVTIYGVYALVRKIPDWLPAPAATKAQDSAPNRVVTEALARADGFVGAKQFDEALELLRGVLGGKIDAASSRTVHAKLGEVHAAKADSLIGLQNFERALQAAREGLKYDAASSRLNYLVGVGFDEKAKSLSIDVPDSRKKKKECYQQSIAALDKAVQCDPNNIDALFLLGSAHARMQEFAEAKKAWEQLIQLVPNSSQAEKARSNIKSLRL